MKFGTLFKNNKLPLLTGKSVVLFPKINVSLNIKNDFEIDAIKEALEKDGLFVFVAQKNNINRYQRKDLFDIGVLCKVIDLKGSDKTNYEVTVEGIQRVKIGELTTGKINHVRVEKIKPMKINKDEVKIAFDELRDNLYKLFNTYNFSIASANQLESIDDAAVFCDYLGMADFFDFKEKQELLEEINVASRIDKINGFINQYLNKNEIKKELKKKVVSQFSKAQREEFLRQQMEEIKRELGDVEDAKKSEYLLKVEKLPVSPAVKKTLLTEIQRLENVPPNSSEHSVIKTYLDWIIAMPWTHQTKDEFSVQTVRERLDKEHYGMNDVKKRILEFLAINQLNKGVGKSPIICLVGPPGTGKTSLAVSIANAIGRKFSRTSLGGVRDEAEIRGHRRTYVAAMPGRIIQSMKRAESKNPVILLDEIDKMTNTNQGDPAAALLEVLDPEQNHEFTDHYLDIPFDLSKTMFIATANNADYIPEPLRDRMEIIEITNYTEREKYHISKNHLLPKVIEDHGLTNEMIEFEDLAINRVVHFYTRESGVRDLKRMFARICRYVAIEWLENQKKVKVDEGIVTKVLGPPIYTKDKILIEMEPGISTGLAWTPYGGDILFIETSLVKNGSGKIQITGQIGNVMRESAQIALSYILSNADRLKLPIDEIKRHDYHLHIPSGAVKKDGPSAGITIFSSMLSALMDTKLPSDLGMSGEISLKGKILPVGGLKQKIIAAHFAGITKVILSKDNEQDILKEVPEDVRNQMQFIYMAHLNQLHDYLFKANTEP